MVADYYNLREQPFGVTPDSRYLFLSGTHREALGSLVYGLASGCGFVALIATPGMGKTMLLFDFVSRVRNKSKVVFLSQTLSTPIDCLRAILADLGVQETAGSLFDLQSRLNQVLAEESRTGRHLVVVFDEAQALDDSVLEFVRMLSNFETPQEKLIQVVLTGQPELADKLASPQLLQLRQRISIVAHLRPFSAEETALYIDHRLRTAGYLLNEPLFSAEALASIARSSQGIPRNINNLCFNALSLGCALKRKQIDADIIREIVQDLELESLGRPKFETARQDEGRTPIDRDNVREAVCDFKRESLAPAKCEPDDGSEEWNPIGEVIAHHAVHYTDLKPPMQVSSELHHGDGDRKQIDAGIQGKTAEDTGPEPSARIGYEHERPHEVRGGEVPLFASIGGAPSTLWSRLAKVAMASAVLLGLSVYQLRVRGASAPEVSVQARPVAPPTVPEPPLSSSGNSTRQLTPEVSTVEVTPGKSLYRICTATFGTCSPERIQEIRKLNPRLTNPDHIESGQKIQLPVIAAGLAETGSILEAAGITTPEKKGMQ